MHGLGEQGEAFGWFEIEFDRMRAGQPRFLHGAATRSGEPNIAWVRPDGEAMQDHDWNNPVTRSMGALLSNDTSHILMLFNSHHEPIDFVLPPAGTAWSLLLDTADGTISPLKGKPMADRLVVRDRALVVLEDGLGHD